MRGPRGDARLAVALASLLIALTVTTLLLLALSTVRFAPAADAAPLDTPAATATVTTATATPQRTQPTLALVSPSSGQGPVGANVTFTGSHWNGSQVNLAAATTSCASPAGTLGQTQVGASGSFSVTLTWPTSLATSGTNYLLCASDNTSASATATQTYRVRSAAPPALALSLNQIAAGQEVQIQGSNFVGASSVALQIQTSRTTRALPTVTPDPKDGSFVASYTPTSADIGSVTLTAASAPESSAPPALQASVTLTVGPPLPATPTLVATQPVANGPAIITRPSDSFAPSVLLAVGALLGLLALVGLVAWLLLRPRPAHQPAPSLRDRTPPGTLPGVPPVAHGGARPSPAPRVERETARVPVGAPARSSRADRAAFPQDDAPDASAPPEGWRRRPMSGQLWRYADEAHRGAVPRAVRPRGSRGYPADDRGGYPAEYGYGRDDYLDDDGPPTTPSSGGYFGLPSLESPDAAATQPNGPALPEAHE